LVISDLTELEASANSIKVLREHQQALEASQAELRKQKEWLQVTMRSIGDAVIATDDEGRISFLNPAATALTGWTEQEALGRPVRDVFHIIDDTTRRPGEDVVARALSEGKTVGLTGATSLIVRDGRIVVVAPAGDGRPAVDTTGAGDLWASGFLYGLVEGYPLEKCGELGSACGYEVCQVVGASIPDDGWQRIRNSLEKSEK